MRIGADMIHIDLYEKCKELLDAAETLCCMSGKIKSALIAKNLTGCIKRLEDLEDLVEECRKIERESEKFYADQGAGYIHAPNIPESICHCGEKMEDHHEGSSCTSPKEMVPLIGEKIMDKSPERVTKELTELLREALESVNQEYGIDKVTYDEKRQKFIVEFDVVFVEEDDFIGFENY